MRTSGLVSAEADMRCSPSCGASTVRTGSGSCKPRCSRPKYFFSHASAQAGRVGSGVDFVEFIADQQVLVARVEPVEFSQKLLMARAARLGVFGVGDLSLAQPSSQRLLFLAQFPFDAVELQIQLQILFDV